MPGKEEWRNMVSAIDTQTERATESILVLTPDEARFMDLCEASVGFPGCGLSTLEARRLRRIWDRVITIDLRNRYAVSA